MGNRTKDVTEAEFAVLQALWDRDGATIRELTAVLYPQGQASQYATVQKLLERLEGKGCVERRTESRAHQFRAAVDRDDLIGRELRRTADRLCEGSLTPLLTHLARSSRLDRAELDELRKLVDDLERETDRSKRERGPA